MEANAATLDLFQVTEVELIYKGKGNCVRPVIRTSTDAYNILRQSWDDNKLELVEQFKILLIDTNGECLGISEVAQGSINGCVVDPRLVFAIALKSRAVSLILAHNHPSGALHPSKADLQLTRKLTEGGNILDLSVLDHLIISKNGFYSINHEHTMHPEPF